MAQQILIAVDSSGFIMGTVNSPSGHAYLEANHPGLEVHEVDEATRAEIAKDHTKWGHDGANVIPHPDHTTNRPGNGFRKTHGNPPGQAK